MTPAFTLALLLLSHEILDVRAGEEPTGEPSQLQVQLSSQDHQPMTTEEWSRYVNQLYQEPQHMRETRHVNKYKHHYGGRTTAAARRSSSPHQAQPVEQLVDKIIRTWHEHTQGKDGAMCRAAARELSTMFDTAAGDNP